MSIRIFVFVCLVSFVQLFDSQYLLGQPEELITVAEKSQFKSTSRSEEVVEFIKACDAKADWVSFFEFGKTVEGRPLAAALVGQNVDGITDHDERPRILLLGNIHSGECAGKEALLQLLREVTLDKNHAWVREAIVVFAPNYNSDGNNRIGKNEFHRPGQVGPFNGMGVRENAQQLDLNRDFMKLESPEARSLIALIDEFDPHLFIDCHTTNGSRHRYSLTYDIPHNLSSPETVRKFLRNNMMPTVTDRLTEKEMNTFYYGNLSRDGSRWFTFGHEPRYSTEYVGLRGRLGVLSEAYSYISYEERIKASYLFVKECVDFVIENSGEVIKLLEDSENQFVETASSDPSTIAVHLGARAVPFEKKVTILGYDGDEPKDFEVEFVGNYESTRAVALPYAYIVGNEFARQIDRLRLHGIEIYQLTEDVDLEVVANRIKSIQKMERVFQGHNLVTLETTTETLQKTIIKGTYVIPTNQKLGQLAAYLLEPTSDDGLVTWNFFDPWLHEKNLFPVLRLEQKADLPKKLVTSIEPKTKLTADLLFGEAKINFSGSNSEVPTWVDGKDKYRMTWHSTFSSRRVEVDASSGAMTPVQNIWNRADLIAALEELDGLEDSANSIAGSANEATVSPDESSILFQHGEDVYLFQIDQKRAFQLSADNSEIELAKFSPDGQSIAYVIDGNLYMFSIKEGTQKAITTLDGSKYFSGKLDWTYQEELYGRGNFKGFWWAPDSKRIAYLQLDVTKIIPYTIKDNVEVGDSIEIMPYPKAGEDQAIPKLAVYDSNSGKSVFADLGKHNDSGCDIVISQVTWHPDSKQIAAQVQNRSQTFLDFVVVDTGSGKSELVFRDETPAWIESPGAPIWINNDSFLWMSPKNGTNQIYLMNMEGEVVEQLTDDRFGIQSILGFRDTDQTVFLASKPDGIRQHIYSLDLGTKDRKQLTTAPGHHVANFNDQFTYFFDIYSTHSQPSKTELRSVDGELVRVIDPNIDDTLKYLDIKEPEFVRIEFDVTQANQTGDDAKTIRHETDAILIKPSDFDESKKYPVLYHVYSGPQAPTVRDQFRGSWYLWHQMLAQHGYVIFMCDNRSSTHKGAKDAWPIHRNLGEYELSDIEAAVGWLHQQSWVDKDRIGIWGWSYGGYMTAYAMTHSKLFKAGISGAPVTDWKNYDTIYTERYMGTPDDNPEGYKRSSVVEAASDLHGRMLLIHGSIDDNVHISNTMQLVFALQNSGKTFDLMIYPRNRHGIRREPQVRHLQETMKQFILNNL